MVKKPIIINLKERPSKIYQLLYPNEDEIRLAIADKTETWAIIAFDRKHFNKLLKRLKPLTKEKITEMKKASLIKQKMTEVNKNG